MCVRCLQTANGTYDLEAYLAVLKLYQFKHAQFDLETTRAILLKAMTAMPSNDFSLCLGLLSLQQQENPQIQPLVYMADLLETCMFVEFWAYLEENPQLTEVKFRLETEEGTAYETMEMLHFKESIRQCECCNVAAGIVSGRLPPSLSTRTMGSGSPNPRRSSCCLFVSHHTFSRFCLSDFFHRLRIPRHSVPPSNTLTLSCSLQ